MDKKEGATTGELETPGSLYTVCNWAGIAKEKGRGLVSNVPSPQCLQLCTHLSITLNTCSRSQSSQCLQLCTHT